MKAYEIVSAGGIDALQLAERPTRDPGRARCWCVSARRPSTTAT